MMLILIIIFSILFDVSGHENTLINLAREGNVEKLSASLTENANLVNVVDSQGESPLMAAVFANHIETVKLLISHGGNVNARRVGGEMSGSTSLFDAAFAGSLEMTTILLNAGADVRVSIDSENMAGCTALAAAVLGGHTEIVDLLIKSGANVNAAITSGDMAGMTPLILAAPKGDPKIIRVLTKYGADVNALVNGGESIGSGASALSFAVEGGNMETVRLLLERNADVNVMYKSRGSSEITTPLITAFTQNNIEMVNLLVDEGRRFDKTHALILAAKHGHVSVIDKLIEKEVNVNELPTAGEYAGVSALLVAIAKGKADAAEALIRAGADPNAMLPKPRMSALMLAVVIGLKIEIIESLLHKGAKPNVAMETGDSALHFACNKGRYDVARLLVASGAKLYALNAQGVSPIQYVTNVEDKQELMRLVETWEDGQAGSEL